MAAQPAQLLQLRTRLQGTDGRILIGTSFLSLFKACEPHHASGFRDLAESPFPVRAQFRSAYLCWVEDMVQCLQTGREPVDTGEDGLKALEIIEAVLKSSRNGGAPVTVPF